MPPKNHSFIFMAAALLPLFRINANPHPMITPAPEFHQHLVHREDSGPNVYGYISGDINSPLGCGAGYQWQQLSEFGACCNEATCTSAVFTCVNSGEPNPCVGVSSYLCALGNGISALSCKSPTPSCFQYMVMNGPQDTNPAYVARCGTVSTVIEVFMSATNEAEATSSPDQSSVAEEKISTNSKAAKSRTQSANSPAGETAGSSNDSNKSSVSPSQTEQNDNGNKSHTTIIIAVAIGAVIIIVAAVVGGMLLRKRIVKRRPVLQPQAPAVVPTIPTNYGGSDDGRNPVLENEAKVQSINQWSSQVSTLSNDSARTGLLTPSSNQTYEHPSNNFHAYGQQRRF